ncbi:hypothetical protein [Prevotella sp.]|uniref:hypothetical protein n=1 Tax=Prevotella sp. TaxID=59823 RepID=UPI0027E30C78|nr:hypothetical protein [Prevotella sp.]
MNEQNLPENTKKEVKETAVPVVSNDSQEINNDSPPKLKENTGSKGKTNSNEASKSDDYVAAERAWSEKQNKKKEALRKIYHDTSEEDNVLFTRGGYYYIIAKQKIAYRVQRQKSFPLYAIIL